MNAFRFASILCLSAAVLSGCAAWKKQKTITHWSRPDTSQGQLRSDYSACRRYAYREAGDYMERVDESHHRDDRSYQNNMAHYNAKRSYTSTLNNCMKRLGYRPLGSAPKKPSSNTEEK